MTMRKAIGLLALLSGFMLSACGGGAETVENLAGTGSNDDGNTSTKPPYTGPAPISEDVQSFRLEFWENARGTDRCGSCHTPEGGQTPYFVRWDDVNLAYEEAVPRIDRDAPANSEFVTKVGTPPLGHNCWVDDPGTCATIMTGWIERWTGFVAGGGRQIQLPPIRRCSKLTCGAMIGCCNTARTATAPRRRRRSNPTSPTRTSPSLTSR
jgi:hypothetical protein